MASHTFMFMAILFRLEELSEFDLGQFAFPC